jgi:hypothetical protein
MRQVLPPRVSHAAVAELGVEVLDFESGRAERVLRFRGQRAVHLDLEPIPHLCVLLHELQ